MPCGTLLNWVVFVLVLLSWVYRTGLFLLACVIFRLTCELQILRFEGLHKLFEGRESDANSIFREHVRIRRQLWITSHRYRFFIISCLVTITVSQLTSLLLVLESKSDTTFFNSGDLVVKPLLHFIKFCCSIFFLGQSQENLLVVGADLFCCAVVWIYLVLDWCCENHTQGSRASVNCSKVAHGDDQCIC